MKLRDQYDWIVFGEHPGALLSAALVAKLGLSVLVVPMEHSLHAFVSESGQCVDPETNFILGLGSTDRASGLLRECLMKLGIASADLERVASRVPMQVLTPQKRAVFTPDDESFRRELLREFGSEAPSVTSLADALSQIESHVSAYWKSLPDQFLLTPAAAEQGRRSKAVTGAKAGPVSLRQFRKRLASLARVSPSGKGDARAWFEFSGGLSGRMSAVPGFMEFVSGLRFATGYVDRECPSPGEFVESLALARSGASFRGGITAYRQMLLQLALKLGAHTSGDASLQQIFLEQGRFAGVQLSGRGSIIPGAGAVLGCSLSQAREKIRGSSGKGFRSAGLAEAPSPVGWRFTLGLTVHAEAIPPGATSHMVWSEPGAPRLEIEVADAESYGVEEPEHRLIFLRSEMPFDQESLRVDYQRMIAGRMFRKLSELIPFLEYHVVRIHPDFRTESNELSETYGFASPDLIPENLRIMGGQGKGSGTGIEGLFTATGESFPEMSSMGGTVAALEASAWIAHRRGLPGPIA